MGLLSDKTRSVVASPKVGSLEHYFSDELATAAVSNAESSPEAAKDALLIAADYLKRGVPLPGILASHLADAIGAAMAKPQELRAKALTDELLLSAVNRRPSANWLLVGAAVERHISQGASKDRALLDVSDEYGISKTTTKRYWKEYKPRSLEFQAEIDVWRLHQKPPTF